jgi:hypothetical protein
MGEAEIDQHAGQIAPCQHELRRYSDALTQLCLGLIKPQRLQLVREVVARIDQTRCDRQRAAIAVDGFIRTLLVS